MSYNPKVQIFSIYNNWVIKFLKMTSLFVLRALFLKRTASEKMFLKRTVYIKYIGKLFFLVNECFFYLNLKIFLCFRHKKCSLIDVTLIFSGSSQTEFPYSLSNGINVSVRSRIYYGTLNKIFSILFSRIYSIVILFGLLMFKMTR